MVAVAFGLKHIEASSVRQALEAVTAAGPVDAPGELIVHDAGPGGVWLLGDRAELRAVAEALAVALDRSLRWYIARIDGGQLTGLGRVLHPDGRSSAIAGATDRAPATDPDEAQAWIHIRLEVEEGLDDHDASRQSLVWPGATG